MHSEHRGRERIEFGLMLAACAFLILLAGMLLARYDKFPYPFVDRAVRGVGAAATQLGLVKDMETGADASDDGERSSAEAGVARFDTAAASPGFTLMTSGSAEEALLVDMKGRTVHRWSMPVATVRERFGDGKRPVDTPVSWRSFHLYPDGSLLVVLHGENVTPYGLGLLKLDKDSNLLWANLDHAHHDVVVAEDGLIYTLSQEIRDTPVADLGTLQPPFLEDFVLVLNPEGQIVHRRSVMEAFTGTPFASSVKRLANRRDWKGDYFHVNAIEPYDSRNVSPVLGSNQVLISIRNMDALATMDLGTGKIVWLLRGSWHRQHDPDLVGDRILLFDNRGDFARNARTRIIELEPSTGGITWSANENDQYALYSGWGGNQQVLENGNVLITESAHGRVLEVTHDGRLVWEFFGALRDEGGRYAAPILEARRYPPPYLQFTPTLAEEETPQ
jgi:hypothetical protein